MEEYQMSYTRRIESLGEILIFYYWISEHNIKVFHPPVAQAFTYCERIMFNKLKNIFRRTKLKQHKSNEKQNKKINNYMKSLQRILNMTKRESIRKMMSGSNQGQH